MINNLGVEKHLKFRQVILCKRKKNETKDSLIVCIVESYAPKDVALPAKVPDSTLRKSSLRVPDGGSWKPSSFDSNVDFSEVLNNDGNI